MAKIKNKTKSAAKKRFKVTGSGKVMRMRSHVGHNTGNKSSTHKRRLHQVIEVPEQLQKTVEKLIGLR